jgi:Methyltransferase domain
VIDALCLRAPDQGKQMAEHVYNSDFYDYIDDGSRRSARTLAPLILGQMQVGSLLDVGAGHGAWAAEWLAAGVADVLAVDGDYVARDRLQVPAENFSAHDLLQPLDLGRKFDLVQSLEVAEHLPGAKADQFVETLTRHGDVVLFSAAVPHQGGEHHVNEQPPQYWREKFAARGYAAFDWVRPQLAGREEVKPWYRFNAVLYANEAGQARIGAAIKAARVDEGVTLPMGGDWRWTARRTAVRLIPGGLVKPVAMAKAALEARLRGRAGGSHG